LQAPAGQAVFEYAQAELQPCDNIAIMLYTATKLSKMFPSGGQHGLVVHSLMDASNRQGLLQVLVLLHQLLPLLCMVLRHQLLPLLCMVLLLSQHRGCAGAPQQESPVLRYSLRMGTVLHTLWLLPTSAFPPTAGSVASFLSLPAETCQVAVWTAWLCELQLEAPRAVLVYHGVAPQTLLHPLPNDISAAAAAAALDADGAAAVPGSE